MKLTNILKQVLNESAQQYPVAQLEFPRDIRPGDSAPSATAVGTRHVIRDDIDFSTWKDDMVNKWGPALQIRIDRQATSRLDVITIPRIPTKENEEYHKYTDRISHSISQDYKGRRYTGD